VADRKEALQRALDSRRRSLGELQSEFTGRHFPGGNALPQDVIRVHDAAHQFANISPTPRGEVQQQVVDFFGGQRLAEETGARGFANTVPIDFVTTEEYTSRELDRALEDIKKATRSLETGAMDGRVRQAGVGFNDPGSFQFPAISAEEGRELAERGRKFYIQLAEPIRSAVGPSEDVVSDNFEFQAAEGAPPVELGVNKGAAFVHRSPALEIVGGYDSAGGLPYGPIEQMMNTPLHQTVKEGDYGRHAVRAIQRTAANPADLGLPEQRESILSVFDIEDKDDWQRQIDAIGRGSSNSEVSAATGRALPWDTETQFLDGVPRNNVANQALLDAKLSGRIADAIKGGFNATADIAGSVPLFDPEFRQAVEDGDLRKAGGKAIQEYATGLLAAPVVGAGAGALQRVAPATAARVLPALAGVARVGNPVAVVSQLGGSVKPSQRQQRIERQQDPQSFGAQGPNANPQLLRAEAARRKGGKWKIGPFTVPELGISEAGGLFFR
jgi:hypothetical protein